MTHRQYAAWQAWTEADMSEPDKSQHYLMQVAAEVRRGNAKRPREVKLEHFAIPFRRKDAPRDAAAEARASKAAWVARMGVPVKVVTPEGGRG